MAGGHRLVDVAVLRREPDGYPCSAVLADGTEFTGPVTVIDRDGSRLGAFHVDGFFVAHENPTTRRQVEAVKALALKSTRLAALVDKDGNIVSVSTMRR